jgi:hypothetical protein
MGAKNDNGLTARQARFAAFLAEGHNQADAYRKAYRAKNMKPETIWSEASRQAHNPDVAARVAELLRDARVIDLDSAYAATARQAGNWTAVAQMHRMRWQRHGLLQEHIILSQTDGMDPDEMCKHLARGNPEMEEMLHKIVGHSCGFTKQ